MVAPVGASGIKVLQNASPEAQFTGAEVAAFKHLYERKGDNAFALNYAKPESLPKSVKARYNLELATHKKAGNLSNDQQPFVEKGSFAGRAIYKVVHGTSDTGDGVAKFYTADGQKFATRIGREYGDSWAR
jgi:hypothetical protein